MDSEGTTAQLNHSGSKSAQGDQALPNARKQNVIGSATHQQTLDQDANNCTMMYRGPLSNAEFRGADPPCN